MKKCLYTCLCAMLVLVTVACGTKEDSAPEKVEIIVNQPVAMSELEVAIPDLMARGMVPGLSIAVIRDGSVAWQKPFGVKNLDTGEPVTDDTVFEAASLSKPMFSYAVMRMVERGELELDKPLLDYVDDSYIEESYLGRKIDDERIRQITARMVMSHQSGFPNWRGRGELKINFEPGEKFSYSGEGFGLLQRVVEKLTGLSVNDFMEREVFAPLGLTHSAYVWRDDFDGLTAFPHTTMMGVAEKRKPGGNRGHAAATLHTTARDYATFLCALLNNTGLSADTVNAILTPQVIADPEETDLVRWGLGFGLELGKRVPSFWHWGDNGNFKAFFLVDPNENAGVVYFANSQHGLTLRNQIVGLTMAGEHPLMQSGILANYGDVDKPSMDMLRVLVKDGVDAALARFKELRKEYPATEIVPEGPTNSMGYYFMGEKDYTSAIKLFQLNVEIYPDSWNVYDSLGEAFKENGDIKLAILNYEKSIELNPDNENGKKILAELRKQ